MGVRAGSSVAALAEKYLDAVSRGDGVGAAERYFHPEILYVVNGGSSDELRSALPWLGRYRGLDEVRGFLAHMHANLDVTGFGPREVVADGERAAVFGWFGLRSRQTGRDARIGYSLLIQGAGGKIVRYQFLENTFDVALAFRSAGAWAMRTDDTTRAAPGQDGDLSC
jgi:ketosteroid isomerase-like protein